MCVRVRQCSDVSWLPRVPARLSGSAAPPAYHCSLIAPLRPFPLRVCCPRAIGRWCEAGRFQLSCIDLSRASDSEVVAPASADARTATDAAAVSGWLLAPAVRMGVEKRIRTPLQTPHGLQTQPSAIIAPADPAKRVGRPTVRLSARRNGVKGCDQLRLNHTGLDAGSNKTDSLRMNVLAHCSASSICMLVAAPLSSQAKLSHPASTALDCFSPHCFPLLAPPRSSSHAMSLVSVKSAETNFKDSILQLQEIFTHFDKLGSEGLNGSISTEKLGEALRESLGVSYSPQELEDMVSAIDLNASGDVQFNEFLKMMDQARADSELLAGGDGRKDEDAEEDALAAAGDAAGDGEEKESSEDRLARAESKRKALESSRADALLAAEAEYQMTRDDIKAIFRVFDTDKDGRVSAAELQAMLQAQGEKYSEEEVHAMIHLVDSSNSGMMSYQAFVRLMMAPED